VGEELVAGGNGAQVVLADVALTLLIGLMRQEAVTARPIPRPLNAPLQRTHHAVVVHRGEPGFPVVHPASVEGRHWFQDSKMSIQHSAISIQWGQLAASLLAFVVGQW
jgi:hypothetical protein